MAGDEAGSSETQTVQRSCGAETSKQYSPENGVGQPSCNDATGKFDPSRTYTATYYSNDVKCGSNGKVADAPVGTVYATGSPSPSGHAGLCADGDEQVKVIQGRAMVGGSFQEEGMHVVIDGDKDNSQNAAAQGWAKAGFDLGGPYVRCGDDNGRKDSDNPTFEDSQADCG